MLVCDMLYVDMWVLICWYVGMDMWYVGMVVGIANVIFLVKIKNELKDQQ